MHSPSPRSDTTKGTVHTCAELWGADCRSARAADECTVDQRHTFWHFVQLLPSQHASSLGSARSVIRRQLSPAMSLRLPTLCRKPPLRPARSACKEKRMRMSVLVENPDSDVELRRPSNFSTPDSSPEDTPKKEDGAGPSGLHD